MFYKNYWKSWCWYISFSVICALLIVLFSECLATSSLRCVSYAVASPKEVIFIAVIFVLVFFAIDCIVGKKFFAIAPLALGAFVLAGVSSQKMAYRGEPFYPWEFAFVRQVTDLIPVLVHGRLGEAFLIVFASLITLLSTIWVMWYRCKGERLTGSVRILLGGCSSLAVVFWLYCVSPSGSTRLYTSTGIMNMSWDQTLNYSKNGFLLAFGFNFSSAIIEVPKVDIQNVLATLEKDHVVDPGFQPATDVVVVMNESFWDPQKLPLVQFSIDPMPTVRKLQKGEILSPTYGGGTANVEFEALTGFSNAFLPKGSLPYQQYIRGNTPTIAWELRAKGYRTIAMHPYHPWFWNRDFVYKRFGFEQFLSLDQLPANKTRGLFYSDTALSEAILAKLQESTQAAFIFAVTMQNHGPYSAGRYEDLQVDIRPDGALDTIERESLKTYAQGIHDGDDALKSLVEGLAKRKRPALVIFFGDHLPMLGLNYELFKKGGFIKVGVLDSDHAELVKMRSTPLVVWSNYLDVSSEQGLISPAFIPNLIDNLIGLHSRFYGDFLGRVIQRYKVIERDLIKLPSGEAKTMKEIHDSEILEAYRSIQYDVLFGGGASALTLYPGLPIICCQRLGLENQPNGQ